MKGLVRSAVPAAPLALLGERNPFGPAWIGVDGDVCFLRRALLQGQAGWLSSLATEG